MKTVFDPEFRTYGEVLTGYDCKELLALLESTTERPANGVVYVPGNEAFEALPVAEALSLGAYGGMPIQVGYCNGSNKKLNCLEYHRGSEVNIPAEDMVFLVAPLQKMVDGVLDTKEVEAFLAPAGTVVLLYETTLHYAPCNAPGTDGFRVVVVLPKNTNTDKPALVERNAEDRLLWARNKWLSAHPDSVEAGQGAFVGLKGENITVE